MVGCRCSYRNCRSTTRFNPDLHFFHYPVKHKERCKEWIQRSRRPEFQILPIDQFKNKVVCSIHFEEKCFTNQDRNKLVHNAIPTLDGYDDADELMAVKNVQVLPANADGTIFTLDTESMVACSDEQPVCTYSFQNGNLVPVYSVSQDNESSQVLYSLGENGFQNFDGNHEYLLIQTFDDTSGKTDLNVSKAPETEVEVQSSLILENPIIFQDSSMLPEYEELHLIYEGDINEIVEEQAPANEGATSEDNQKVPDEVVQNCNIQVSKKVCKQIKRHSRELATIKKSLKKKKCKPKYVLTTLKTLLPNSMWTLVCLQMNKLKTRITPATLDFLNELYSTSPECYSLLRTEMNWPLPDPGQIDELKSQN